MVTKRPATSLSAVWHEKALSPSKWIMHAPHKPAPQPKRVPESFKYSRSTQRSGVSSGASTLTGAPLTWNAIDMSFLPVAPGRTPTIT